MILDRRAPRHAAAFMVACLLELLVVVIFVQALRPAPAAPRVPIVFADTLQLLNEPTRTPKGLPIPVPTEAQPLSMPAVPDLTTLLPAIAGHIEPPLLLPQARVDWGGTAKQAAAALASAAVLTRAQLAASGELPEPTPPAHHAAFPWAHQPRIPWLDFDRRNLTTSVHLGRHCELVFLVILPGFGCLLGHLDSTARGDLFDPTLLPPPLQLPATPAMLRRKPGAPPADDPTDQD
jgi:hypothetical protein